MSTKNEANETETVSARAQCQSDSCHNPEEAASLHTRQLSNRSPAGEASAAFQRAGHLCVLVDITAEGLGSRIQPADALTFIAEQLQASAESLVEAFNRSQGRVKDGLQLSISVTRAISPPHRTQGIEFVAVQPVRS